jgi:hypothetical protein
MATNLHTHIKQVNNSFVYFNPKAFREETGKGKGKVVPVLN